VADYHRDHPNQPIVGTEMGSTVTTGIYEKDTIKGYVPDEDLTFPGGRAQQKPGGPWRHPTIIGWAVCMDGFDYRGTHAYHWPNINSHFGIMDMCGFPKNIYYIIKPVVR
jgi:beta-galactosidase